MVICGQVVQGKAGNGGGMLERHQEVQRGARKHPEQIALKKSLHLDARR